MPVLEISSLAPVLLPEGGGLVSFLDMLRFHAHHFVGISSTLGQMIMDIGAGRIPRTESLQQMGRDCGLLQKYCEELNLPLSAAALKRLKDGIVRLPPRLTQTVKTQLTVR